MSAYKRQNIKMLGLCDDNWAVYSLVDQAIVLEKNYKQMLHQEDEVDLRIQLWRNAIKICKINTKGMPLTHISRP
jgi:hypothetical protein